MSEPLKWEIPLEGIAHEIISGMSALNMEPLPLETPTGTYISDTDHWVRHAMVHFRAACQLASRAARSQDLIVSKLSEILEVAHGVELPWLERCTDEEIIKALDTVIAKLRAARGRPTADDIVRELAAIDADNIPWWLGDVWKKANEFVSQEIGGTNNGKV